VNVVHVVVPSGVDDPRRPSGGNTYDRRLCAELPAWGWTVRESLVDDQLDEVLAGLADGSIVLIDGLIASTARQLVDAARRLRVVVLVHMPFAEADPGIAPVESAVLNAATAVVTTSAWSRDWVTTNLHVPTDRLHVATPGVDSTPLSSGSADGGNLLCVGPVTPDKGQDVLVAALGLLADLDWHCTCVGARDLDPAFVASLTAAAQRAGIAERIEFAGPLTTSALTSVRTQTDLLVSASRREAYGMAVTEALAAGIPVIATDVGGHAEAVGRAGGSVPGVLIPVNDVDALAVALRKWLTDPATRSQWRAAAGRRRGGLTGWGETARTVATVLSQVAG
jgi:glycosyltransferase involved in cell wall biosynthesis